MDATLSADEDDALMLAFARGDAQAFERLYTRHEAALYRFVRRLLGPALAAQADEAFQDTWLRVVSQRAQYLPGQAQAALQGSPQAAFSTWLFTLAHHRCIDLLRRSGREVALPDDDGDEPFQPRGEPWLDWPAAGQAPHDDALFWRRAGERLLACLERLPPGQKAVFLLHHEEGLGLDELAAALALNFEAAKSRLRYAMSKLRTCMGAYLPAGAAP